MFFNKLKLKNKSLNKISDVSFFSLVELQQNFTVSASEENDMEKVREQPDKTLVLLCKQVINSQPIFLP